MKRNSCYESEGVNAMLSMEIGQGLLIPFLGTVLGSGCVFVLRQELRVSVQKALLGFAAGIMIAASVWSLLIPSMDACSGWGSLAFLPALIGFWAGTLFLFLLDHVIPHLHIHGEEPEGPHRDLSKKMMLILAVTLHNIPEGMAVGVVLAGWLSGQTEITGSAALILSVGIAIQNFPEGAIISMPLRAAGMSRGRAFLAGAASGIVEPLGGLLTVAAAQFVTPILPYLLAFAAGAMVYVVVEEILPEMAEGEHSHVGVLSFAAGFTLMMALDVVFSA